MSQQDFTEVTKVTKDQFYQYLCVVFANAIDQQPTEIRLPAFINKWISFTEETEKQPSMTTIMGHFTPYIKNKVPDPDNDMGTILGVIAEQLPSFVDTWDIVAIRKTHILVQLADPTETEEPYEEVKPRKQARPTGNATTIETGLEGTVTGNMYGILDDDDDDTSKEDKTHGTNDKNSANEDDSSSGTHKKDDDNMAKIDEQKLTGDEIKEMLKTTPLSEINLTVLEQYIVDNTIKAIETRFYQEVTPNLDQMFTDRIKLAKKNLEVEMDMSVAEGVTRFNRKSTEMMDKHLSTIVKHIEKLSTMDLEIRNTELKYRTLIDAKLEQATQDFESRVTTCTTSALSKVQQEMNSTIDATSNVVYMAKLQAIEHTSINEYKQELKQLVEQYRKEFTTMINETGNNPTRKTEITPVGSTEQEASHQSNSSNSAINRIKAEVKPHRFAQAAENLNNDIRIQEEKEKANIQVGAIVLLKPPYNVRLLITEVHQTQEGKKYQGVTASDTHMTITPTMVHQIVEHHTDYPCLSIYAKLEAMKAEEVPWEEYVGDDKIKEEREDTIDEDDRGHDNEHHSNKVYNAHATTWTPYQQTLSHNQFRFKNESQPRTISEHLITKYAKEWKLHLASAKHDTENFYNDIKTHLTQYNVLLVNYQTITKDTPLTTITKDNCLNYDQAYKAMARALYVMFKTHQTTIFGSRHHRELLLNYEDEEDGMEYLKELITPHHLALRPKSESTGT